MPVGISRKKRRLQGDFPLLAAIRRLFSRLLIKACIRQGCEKSCKRKISYKTKYRYLGWRDSNPCRPSVPLFGTFRPFRLDLRQQACTSKNENCSKIVYCRVQSSFAWADFCSGKAKPAANTWRICKGFNAAWAKTSRSKPTRVQVPSD